MNVIERYDNSEAGRIGNWMQTYTGRRFWPIDPRPEEVFIEDIAHALANACRYGGHCERFYSVAEHSVLVSYTVPREDALVGLLHDAAEAYVCDVPRPLKDYLPGYKDIEHRVWLAIAARFGLPIDMPPSIKEADNAVLLAEQAQIMKAPPSPWRVRGEAAAVVARCHEPLKAKIDFLLRFDELACGEMWA